MDDLKLLASIVRQQNLKHKSEKHADDSKITQFEDLLIDNRIPDDETATKFNLWRFILH